MDNTTEQPNTQGETNKLEGSDLRAALGFANNILGQTIPPDEEEQGETGEEAPQEALAPQGGENGEEMDKDHMGEEMTKMESKMDEKLETLHPMKFSRRNFVTSTNP